LDISGAIAAGGPAAERLHPVQRLDMDRVFDPHRGQPGIPLMERPIGNSGSTSKLEKL
jgi:hypothetical protein